ELVIFDRMSVTEPSLYVETALEPEDLFSVRRVVDSVYIDARLKGYIVDIVQTTRRPADYGLDLGPYIQLGASPRATIYLGLAAGGLAFVEGRAYVTPQAIKSIAPDVLRHRIAVTYEAEAEEITSESLLERILAHLPVP